MSDESASHPTGHSQPSKDDHHPHSKDENERPEWITKALRLVIGSLVALLISGTITGIEALSHRDTRDRLHGVETSVAHHLAVSQPITLSKVFYRRLFDEHGFGLYQWDAPFNAQIARANVVRHFGGTVVSLANVSKSDSDMLARKAAIDSFNATVDEYRQGQSAVVPLPAQPTPPQLTPDEARAVKAYHDAMTRIDNTSVPLLSDALKPSSGGAMVSGIVFNVLLGLPDAYLNTIRVLLPHALLVVRIGIVVGVFLLAVLMTNGDTRGALVLMFLSPFIVSLIGGLLVVGADIVTHIVTALLPSRHGPVGTPASFWTTISALGTLFTTWAYPKVAEHHLTDAVIRRLPKSIVGEE